MIKRYVHLTLENSNTQFLELFESSNKFFGPLNITHFFRQKNSRYFEYRYLEYLGRSNKIVGPLDNFYFGQLRKFYKVRTFIRFFGKKNTSQKFLVFRKMFS